MSAKLRDISVKNEMQNFAVNSNSLSVNCSVFITFDHKSHSTSISCPRFYFTYHLASLNTTTLFNKHLGERTKVEIRFGPELVI